MKQKKKKHQRISISDDDEAGVSSQSPKAPRKKKRKNSIESVNSNDDLSVCEVASPKKKRKSVKEVETQESVNSNDDLVVCEVASPKKKRKSVKEVETHESVNSNDDLSVCSSTVELPKKKRKSAKEVETMDESIDVDDLDVSSDKNVKPKQRRSTADREIRQYFALNESVDAVAGKKLRKKRIEVPEEEAVDGAPQETLDKRQKEVLFDDTPVIRVVKQKALDVIKLLGEPEKRPKFGKNCRFLVPGKIAPKQPDGYEHIAWDSTTYIVQMARQCILKHDWRLLKDFIPLLMKYRHIKNYAKELAYLYFVVNAETEDDEALEEFRRLCFASVKEPDKRDGSVWYRV